MRAPDVFISLNPTSNRPNLDPCTFTTPWFNRNVAVTRKADPQIGIGRFPLLTRERIPIGVCFGTHQLKTCVTCLIIPTLRISRLGKIGRLQVDVWVPEFG